MAQEVRTPVEMPNVSAVPAAPPAGSIVAYAGAGKFSVKDSTGTVTTLAPTYYNAVRNASGTDLPGQQFLQFIGATVADDAASGATTVTIRTDYATVDGHAIADGTGTELAQRSVLKISGATVTDDAANNATAVTIATDYATVDGHVIYDGTGTSYPQRASLILRGDGVSAIVDEPASDATAVVISGGGGSGDLASYVSNCVLEMSAQAVAFSGTQLTVAAGVKALVPNGFDTNGTWNSVETETTQPTDATEAIGAAESGILFLMADGTLRVLRAELYVESSEIPDPRGDVVWYSPVTNVATEYDAAGDELGQFFGVPIANFATDAAGDVEAVTQRGAVNVANAATLRYWEL